MRVRLNRIEIVDVVRWAARLLSLASIAVLCLFVVGDPPLPGRAGAREWVGLAFFPIGVVVGMLVAWRREAVGAAIGLASLACFYVVYGLGLRGSAAALGWWFVVFSSPLLVFLLAWVWSRAREREAPAQ
jgi:hypothetical protein